MELDLHFAERLPSIKSDYFVIVYSPDFGSSNRRAGHRKIKKLS